MIILGTLTIHPIDLEAIITRLEEKKWTAGHIKIIDTGDQFTLRDANDMLISYVHKSISQHINQD